MVKTISQATFNEVVHENIVELDMSPDEAKDETIKQFEAQGVNLANIVKDLTLNSETGQPLINEAIDEIRTVGSDGLKAACREKLLRNLDTLSAECAKSLAHRVLAGKEDAYGVLLSVLEQCLAVDTAAADQEIARRCLQALNSLCDVQPDLFDKRGLAAAHKLLVLDNALEVVCLTLAWLQKVCIMHEQNRQAIIAGGSLKLLRARLSSVDGSLLRETLTVLRCLVLDDDVRVEFGCAHEHARQISNELLSDLIQLLGAYKDIAVLADLLLTIAALAVRQEFCTQIDDAGGIRLIFDIMMENISVVRLNRMALKLLRVLAGQDTVKVHIVQAGFAPIIKELLHQHASNESLVTAGLLCISMLTLRIKENSATFFETGVPEVVVECMRRHANSKLVQRNAAWAIRNMVSRSRDQCEVWLSYGVEDLLQEDLTTHPSIAQDIRAALRDLGCKVELKEEWTGTAEKKISA